MPALSLITSLYRSEAHLPMYIQRVRDAHTALQSLAPNFALEIVVVANDATDAEKRLLKDFAATPDVTVNVLHVPRESLYASWNRGVDAAQYDALGFWNVDDVRTAAALVDGAERLQANVCELVDFPFDVARPHETVRYPPNFKPDLFSPKTTPGTFFVFHRALYERNGAFDPRFRIVGDYEWSKRDAVREAPYALSDVTAGTFVVHGDNLSNGVRPLEWVEINTVLLWHGAHHELRPVDPDLMREVWQAWGHTGVDLSDEMQQWLWGVDARERYEAYTRERNAHPLLRRIRLALARRGLWHSVEWDVHHGR